MADPDKRLVAVGSAILVIAAAAGALTLFLRERNAQARQSDLLTKELAQGPTVRAARVETAAADRTAPCSIGRRVRSAHPAFLPAWYRACAWADIWAMPR